MGDKRTPTNLLVPGSNTARVRAQRRHEPKPKGDEALMPPAPPWLTPRERVAYSEIASLAAPELARGDALIVEYAAVLLARNRACGWMNDRLAKQFNRVMRTKIVPLKWTMR